MTSSRKKLSAIAKLPERRIENFGAVGLDGEFHRMETQAGREAVQLTSMRPRCRSPHKRNRTSSLRCKCRFRRRLGRIIFAEDSGPEHWSRGPSKALATLLAPPISVAA